MASLNPVSDPVAPSASPFFGFTSRAKPASVNEQYKALGTQILTEGTGFAVGGTVGRLAPIGLLGAVLGGWAFVLVSRRDVSEEAVVD